jgi:hypothetical protein
MSDSGRVLGDSYVDRREAVDAIKTAVDGTKTLPMALQFQKPPDIYGRPISEHGGGKYLVTIHPADGVGAPIKVDVYCMIEALGITCPALQHAFKKIAFCGRRGKGGRMDDIHGVFEAMWRARELEMQRQAQAMGATTGNQREVTRECFE